MPATQFKDFGKKATDLFKKQYDYKTEIKVVNKASGVKLESGLNNAFAGYTKANWKDDIFGDIEIEGHSKGDVKGKFKLCKVTDGVDVTVAGEVKGTVSVEAAYNKDMAAATAKVTHNLEKSCTKISAAAVLGYEDFSLGGMVDLDAAGTPTDYNFGAQYATKELTASVTTAKMAKDINISLFHAYSKSCVLGAQASVSKQTLVLGTDYSLDAKTSIRAKAGSDGTVATALTYKLDAMKVGVSAEYSALGEQPFKAQKFGMSFNFGEF